MKIIEEAVGGHSRGSFPSGGFSCRALMMSQYFGQYFGWRVPTEILYAGNDSITSRETVNEFVRTHDAGLTVMENGEHWFHTEEQLTFLNEWLKKVTAQPLPVDHRQP